MRAKRPLASRILLSAGGEAAFRASAPESATDYANSGPVAPHRRRRPPPATKSSSRACVFPAGPPDGRAPPGSRGCRITTTPWMSLLRPRTSYWAVWTEPRCWAVSDGPRSGSGSPPCQRQSLGALLGFLAAAKPRARPSTTCHRYELLGLRGPRGLRGPGRPRWGCEDRVGYGRTDKKNWLKAYAFGSGQKCLLYHTR